MIGGFESIKNDLFCRMIHSILKRFGLKGSQ